MLLPYASIFRLPAIVSLVMLWRLWTENELTGRSAALFPGWFLVALAVQYFAENKGLWLAGLLLQTALAIFLTLKWKTSL